MTESPGVPVGVTTLFPSMSLPRRGRRPPGSGPPPSGASSRSGVNTLLPLLVDGDGSVGLKLTGERSPWTWVLRALGNVFLPGGSGVKGHRGQVNRGQTPGRGPGGQRSGLTVAVVLEAEGNAVSPRVGPALPRLLKHRNVVLCPGEQRRDLSEPTVPPLTHWSNDQTVV